MNFDAAITGGGPAGSSLSLFLATHGWRVVQIDNGYHKEFKPGEGLIPAAKRILADLDLWEAFSKQGHLPSYGNDSVWGSEVPTSTDFTRSIDGHGWRLDRLAFDRLLRENAVGAGAKSVEGFVERVSGEPGDWQLELRGGSVVNSKWVIDATGRKARIARQMGAIREDKDELLAFFVHFEAAKAGDRYSSSLVEAVPEGWWYNALLPNGHRVVYFFTDAGLPIVKQIQDLEGFTQLLQQSRFVKERLEKYNYRPISQPQSADARSARLDKIAGDHWLAVGDAALSFDPLSSQGIMTALYAGLKAGQTLVGQQSETVPDVSSYTSAMQQVWDVYANNRLKYYRSETRWPNSPFWKKRLVLETSDK